MSNHKKLKYETLLKDDPDFGDATLEGQDYHTVALRYAALDRIYARHPEISKRMLCEITGNSSTAWLSYKKRADKRNARLAEEDKIKQLIIAIRRESNGKYGSPRITKALREQHGLEINHKRVCRLCDDLKRQGLY